MIAQEIFLNNLFNKSAIIWRDWDGDFSSFIGALRGILLEKLHQNNKSIKLYKEINLGLWILDRLLPFDAGDIFLPFIGEKSIVSLGLNLGKDVIPSKRIWSRALYAWGRRLSKKNRDYIYLVPFEEKNEFGEINWKIHQAALAAVIDNYDAKELDSIFQWPDLCGQHQKLEKYHDSSIIIKAFVEQNKDIENRIRKLLKYAKGITEKIDEYHEDGLSLRFDLLNNIVCQLVKDIACKLSVETPSSNLLEVDTHKQIDWFVELLDKYKFHDVLSIYKYIKSPLRENLPIILWIYSHTRENWQQLEEQVYSLSEISPFDFLERMAEIVPADRLNAWERVLTLENCYPIEYFCKWLKPEFRDVLTWLIPSYELCDEAVCCFYSYLSKAPHAVLQALWERNEMIPLWQASVLDRFLFSPDSLKPQPLLYDVQSVENDIRLEDPLNHRGL
jgi:uncharacterized protein involved in tolerance to divalent cations